MKKIFVVGNALNYSSWIDNHKLVDKVEDADIVLFTGGEDVDPSLYGCKKHPTTYSNLQRDLEEKAIFEQVRQDQICLGFGFYRCAIFPKSSPPFRKELVAFYFRSLFRR